MPTEKSVEVLWGVLQRVLWEIGVLCGVLPRALKGLGGAPASALEGAQHGGINRKSALGSTCWATPEPLEHPQEHPPEHPNVPEHPHEHFPEHFRISQLGSHVYGRGHCSTSVPTVSFVLRWAIFCVIQSLCHSKIDWLSNYRFPQTP